MTKKQMLQEIRSLKSNVNARFAHEHDNEENNNENV